MDATVAQASGRPHQAPVWSRLRALFSLDLRSLAVFRIALGVILLVDLASRSGDLTAHYSDLGVLPRSAVVPSSDLGGTRPIGSFMPHFLSGSSSFQALLFVLAGIFAAFLILGLHTRVAALTSWILLFSLQARNPLVLHSGDTLLRLLLFWSLFLPLGSRWSLDAIRTKQREPRPMAVFSAASVALLLQVCFMYWFSAAWKAHPIWYREGSAVYYALSIDQMVTPLGSFLLNFPVLLTVLTFATLALETFGPLLALCPFWTGPVRLGVIVAFLFFHLVGLGLCIELGTFPWICAIAWLPWLPPWFWNKLAATRLTPFRRPPASEQPVQAALSARWPVNVAVALLLVYVLLWNLRTLPRARLGWVLPQPLTGPGYVIGINQKWAMFAPYPMKNDGWHVIRGTLNDGTTLDVFRNGAALTWHKPERVAVLYENPRWRKYLMNFSRKDFASQRKDYVDYLCREWNSQHSGRQQLASLDIFFMCERTLPDYGVATTERMLLHAHSLPREHSFANR